jgi:hypothetical protein
VRAGSRILAPRADLFFDGVQGVLRDPEPGGNLLEVGGRGASAEVRLDHLGEALARKLLPSQRLIGFGVELDCPAVHALIIAATAAQVKARPRVRRAFSQAP